MPSPTVEQLKSVDSWEGLAELYDLDALVGVLITRAKQREKGKAKNAQERAILKYARENPEQFENIPQ